MTLLRGYIRLLQGRLNGESAKDSLTPLSRGAGWGTLCAVHTSLKVVRTPEFSWSPPRGGRCEYTASLHPRPSVRGEEPHPTRGDPVNAEHSGSKGINLEKQFLILRCRSRA